MSQTYKFKSLSITNNDKIKDNYQEDENLSVFALGESKTIDFRLKGGSRQCFHYTHFISAWMGKEDELQFIKIFFSTHLVTIKGYCLEELYDCLIEHKVKNITEYDERYASMVEESKVFVIEIEISWKKDREEHEK
ncbi:hypothetical protein [Flagellimonas onchidii]|uniref:hypothetical protein n=1 Tax=Flagellimonas onchidii TaxID=2562684 RepID=UPI0010A5CCFA|nr:hypothetical protein [Allomuricauda onchidii]